ncbi:MAG: hypothetical protein AAF170_18180 [Bacteroidota bacterium]
MLRFVLVLCVFALAACSTPVVPDGPAPRIAPPASSWRQHDMDRPQPPRVEPPPLPADAVQLITPGLDAWMHADGSPARWTHDGDALVIAPGTGDLQTRQSFGDLQLHLEWQPSESTRRPGRSRSRITAARCAFGVCGSARSPSALLPRLDMTAGDGHAHRPPARPAGGHLHPTQ